MSIVGTLFAGSLRRCLGQITLAFENSRKEEITLRNSHRCENGRDVAVFLSRLKINTKQKERVFHSNNNNNFKPKRNSGAL
ncbi:hypothetical protein DAPPUDRAFT_232856 [Daphnia pulex]|uniref:Uncharacterized protein n=1 Tax=Daphnia pulex TaxID=6669 RepID=E9FSJ3_DAPPU|nr:hypothetical protein DAPPUDRAFT_232856 [Daphnia pulex]|eukprot:EFX89217.1 hypothetical protein DAPPUDRAFT_232856 [Daphnia pulex]